LPKSRVDARRQIERAIELDELNHHGITMMALEHGWLSGDIKRQAEQLKRQVIAHELLLKYNLSEITDCLNKSIDGHWLFLKGTGLAYSLYKEPWLRPRSDVDILVDKAHVDIASQTLESAGFIRLLSIDGTQVSHQASFRKQLSDHKSILIDLHWQLNNRPSLAFLYTFEELKRQAISLPKINQKAHTPNKIDSLLIACMHRIGHHKHDERLTWLHDIHLIAEALNIDEWQTLITTCKNKKLSTICFNALVTCTDLFSTNIPTHVSTEFSTLLEEKNHRETSALLLQDLPAWRYALIDLSTLSMPQKINYVRENLFPSPVYMKRQFPKLPLLVSYPYRLFRGIKRILTN